jgi:hypothetical protein
VFFGGLTVCLEHLAPLLQDLLQSHHDDVFRSTSKDMSEEDRFS